MNHYCPDYEVSHTPPVKKNVFPTSFFFPMSFLIPDCLPSLYNSPSNLKVRQHIELKENVGPVSRKPEFSPVSATN